MTLKIDKNLMHHPGLEPGSTAWKAAILTARLMMLSDILPPLLPLIFSQTLSPSFVLPFTSNSKTWRGLKLMILVLIGNLKK